MGSSFCGARALRVRAESGAQPYTEYLLEDLLSLITLFYFVAGLVLLIVGAESLVRGASRLAAAARISPLVVGLTVVAFGTSAPELAVSLHSSLVGQAEIAIGNVVGSNICNVLLILGLSALITPLSVSQQLVRQDVPLMIGASVVLWLFALSGTINRWEGGILFAAILLYTFFSIWKSRRTGTVEGAAQDGDTEIAPGAASDGEPAAQSAEHPLVQVLWMVGGLVLLVLGARWLVDSATTFAQALGVSQFIIGLTVVALGTSLPEVATSLVASLRGERDIAVGNVVGSNLFNLLAVVGAAGLAAPAGVTVSSTALQVDLPIMIAVAVACLPIFFTGHQIARWEGALFLGYYVAYMAFLVLSTTGNAVLPAFADVMLLLVIPLTAIALLVFTMRAWRRGDAVGA